jgi:hypothetical protein
MPRLTTIAIDGQPAAAPECIRGWVQRRLIKLQCRTAMPQARRRASPAPGRQWRLNGRTCSAVPMPSERSCNPGAFNAGVSAEDLSRSEEAHDWLRIILAPYPTERICLASWATAIAYRRSLRRLLLQRRWSRSTFYRYVTAGAHVIALELERQGQPVV